jgi:polyhydroxyalkanoate synthesis regulator phasin
MYAIPKIIFPSKILNILLIFKLLINISSIYINNEYCSELKDIINKPYSEIILYITNKIEILKEKSQSCIDILVKNGKLEELDYYLNELAKKGIQYRENLALSINTMKKSLDEINNKHRFEKKRISNNFTCI